MSDDETDYMSDAFLQSCVQNASGGGSRPGLLFSHKQRRAAAVQRERERATERHRQLNKPRAVLENEHRARGLAQPIDASNKGFAMMKMMGYKPGTAIGKQGDGRLEPVQVELKADRGGLGRQAALLELRRRKSAIFAARRRRCAANAADEFRRRMRDKIADRRQQADLMKSQRVCQLLDEKISVDSPAEPWFWPAAGVKDSGDEEDEQQEGAGLATVEPEAGEQDHDEGEDREGEEETVTVEFSCAEKLEMLTEYLRRSHCYCIWCGCSFQDDDDLREHCPGNTRDDHS